MVIFDGNDEIDLKCVKSGVKVVIEIGSWDTISGHGEVRDSAVSLGELLTIIERRDEGIALILPIICKDSKIGDPGSRALSDKVIGPRIRSNLQRLVGAIRRNSLIADGNSVPLILSSQMISSR